MVLVRLFFLGFRINLGFRSKWAQQLCIWLIPNGTQIWSLLSRKVPVQNPYYLCISVILLSKAGLHVSSQLDLIMTVSRKSVTSQPGPSREISDSRKHFGVATGLSCLVAKHFAPIHLNWNYGSTLQMGHLVHASSGLVCPLVQSVPCCGLRRATVENCSG